jgi:hypothetical protein
MASCVEGQHITHMAYGPNFREDLYFYELRLIIPSSGKFGAQVEG